MKKTILSFVFILPFLLNAQSYQVNAPWMQSDNLLKKKGKLTFNDITSAAEAYFNTIDKFQKGSGYKPFKRWEYHWSHYVKPDGTISTAKDLWNAWEQKNALNSQARNNNNNVDDSDWKSVGPYSHTNTASWSPGQGRVNVVAVDPQNSNTYYVGAPAGGIWKSTDAGVNWQPLADHLPQIGVSGIVIHPTDSNIIYIATGDDDGGDSGSIGVMKSVDGGLTWNKTGTLNASAMNDIFILPNATNTLMLASNTGVFKSIDGGGTWSQKIAINARDLKMKPGDPTTWYAATDSKIYRSTNSGETFTEVVVNGFSGAKRIVLEVTNANPNVVYFISSTGPKNTFNGIYKSSDSGATFVKKAETDNIYESTQAWFDLAMTVSDVDENVIFVGVLNIWKSTDGGDNFSKINNWSSPNEPAYTHADIHFLRYIDGKLFAGTDGGVYVSTDHGTKFTDLTENLAIGQFYRISVAAQKSGNIAGGLQDNGGYALSDGKWNNYFGADGMDTAIDPNNPDAFYGFIQFGGNLYGTTDGGKTRSFFLSAPAAEVGQDDSGGRWITPLVSNSKGELLAGYGQLYKMSNNQWTKLSNHNFGGDLYTIEVDPNNDNNVYVTRSSNLYRSSNGGTTFANVPFNQGTIQSVEISHASAAVAWVVTTNGVYKTTNLTSLNPTFTDITGNLPAESKLVIRHHARGSNNRVYLGTSLGVYYLDDTMNTNWQVYDNKLPNVAIRDLEINNDDSKLFAGTYGRGVFYTVIPSALPTTDIRLVSIENPVKSVMSCDGAITPEIIIKNQGTADLTTATINYKLNNGATSTVNWNGTITSGNTLKVALPVNNWAKGYHTLDVDVDTPNDTYNTNNKQSVSFLINESNTTPTTVNTFENASDNLAVQKIGNGNQVWKRGQPAKTLLNPGNNLSNVYATSLILEYQTNITGYLYTGCYDLTKITNPIFKFKMAFDIEENWDYLNVQYSTDKGATWKILGASTDANWYNSNSTANNLPGKQWTGEGEKNNNLGGTNATMHNYSYDLAAFKDESDITFRFAFHSDDAATEEGVVIDDLVIDGVLPVEEFESTIEGLTVYPNPSSGLFSIDWSQGKSFSISVFDIAGKLILKKEDSQLSSKQYKLDLSKYTPGIYFAKIKIDEKETTKKLVVK